MNIESKEEVYEDNIDKLSESQRLAVDTIISKYKELRDLAQASGFIVSFSIDKAPSIKKVLN